MHHNQYHRHRVGRIQAPAITPTSQLHQQIYKNPLSQAPETPPPKVYPNNTLVEDLSKCHQNLWPKAARATSNSIKLIKSCLPKKAPAKSDNNNNNNNNNNNHQLASKCANGLENGLIGLDLEQQHQQYLERRQSVVVLSNHHHYHQQVHNHNHQNHNHYHHYQHNNNNHNNNNHHHHYLVDCFEASKVKPPAKKQLEANRTRNSSRRLAPRTRMRKEYKFPMPASILKLNSTLTQDDYNRALCMLKNDIRFQLHIFLYRRLQTIWILFSSVLCIFLPILLSAHLETIVILGSCLLWLILQAAGLVVGGRCRKKLDLMLERSVAQVNSYFMDHKLMLGVINVGGLCKRSRLVIPMVYFDTFGCIEQIESIVSTDLKSIEADRNGDSKHKQQVALDYSKIGLHRMEPNQRALAKSQLAKKIVLRFSQRWISHFDGSKLMFTDDDVTRPRHLSTGKCLCQFIEEHFKSNQSEQIKDLDDEPLDDCCKVEMTNDTSAPTPNTTLTTTSTTATTTTITTSTTTQPEFEENNQAIMQHKINRPLIIDLANNYNGLLEQYAALLQSQKNYCRDEFDPELNVSKLDELLKGELLRNKMFDEQMGQIRDSILHMTSENCEKTPIITTRFNKPLQV